MSNLSKLKEKILLFLYDSEKTNANKIANSLIVNNYTKNVRSALKSDNGLIPKGFVKSKPSGKRKEKEKFWITKEGKRKLEKHIQKDVQDLRKRPKLEGKVL